MNYDALAAAYTSAQTAYNSAVNAWNTARNQRDTWETKVTEAKEALEKASASDALDDLYEKRENCTLRAETTGKVTAINVTVGSMAGNNTTIATIQDTEALKISVTIPEYEIQNVELGMSAKITTDATEGEIEGTLTQISPVASSQNSTGFSAEVTVTTPDSGLYVGINATVEIIQSSVDNVFVVPIDAVGTNDQGEAVVFVKESGSGADAVFKEVSVTTGEENDYYIEISSSQLSEGMEVRSSADPEQAQVNMTEGNAQDLSNNAGVQFDMGGAMPSGEMPSGGGRAETAACGRPGRQWMSTPHLPVITMQGIIKRYYIGKPNELEILHGIDLQVEPGEFVAIVGESGSGKSTMMNILGALDRPTEGHYRLNGVDIQTAGDKELAQIRNQQIGFVFQTFNLIGRMSALKNVELPMLYAGVSARERTERAGRLLELVGMSEPEETSAQ